MTDQELKILAHQMSVKGIKGKYVAKKLGCSLMDIYSFMLGYERKTFWQLDLSALKKLILEYDEKIDVNKGEQTKLF